MKLINKKKVGLSDSREIWLKGIQRVGAGRAMKIERAKKREETKSPHPNYH